MLSVPAPESAPDPRCTDPTLLLNVEVPVPRVNPELVSVVVPVPPLEKLMVELDNESAPLPRFLSASTLIVEDDALIEGLAKLLLELCSVADVNDNVPEPRIALEPRYSVELWTCNVPDSPELLLLIVVVPPVSFKVVPFAFDKAPFNVVVPVVLIVLIPDELIGQSNVIPFGNCSVLAVSVICAVELKLAVDPKLRVDPDPTARVPKKFGLSAVTTVTPLVK